MRRPETVPVTCRRCKREAPLANLRWWPEAVGWLGECECGNSQLVRLDQLISPGRIQEVIRAITACVAAVQEEDVLSRTRNNGAKQTHARQNTLAALKDCHDLLWALWHIETEDKDDDRK